MSFNSSTSGDITCQILVSRFGLGIEELYQAALEFYRREGQNLQLTYGQKTQLSAFCKQVALGKFTPEKAPDIGLLNIVGSDRRAAWQHLGDLSKDDSMDGFCRILLEACPSEMEVVLSHASHLKQQQILAQEKAKQEEREIAKRLEKEKVEAKELAKRGQLKQEQEAARREWLQCEQEKLQTGLVEQQQEEEAVPSSSLADEQANVCKDALELLAHSPKSSHSIMAQANDSQSQASGLDMSVKMWLRSDVNDFIAKMDSDNVIVVGRGEAVTVRVPTHSEGSILVFEFTTEHYDIGFGASFEWPADPTVQLKSPTVDCLLPLKRYNSHCQVVAGSHRYRGPGTYLLKFDNTYSMIRSKTLFYHVFYKP